MGSDLILNKIIILIIASISVLLFISCSDYANPVLVQRVIDGDTILLETGERVRYLDIDTPETVHPTKPVQCFGTQAYLRNKELVENKYVTLKQSNTNKDQYGRLLRYVYIEDLFINAVLVSEGYAFAKDYNNPGHLYEELKSLELNAIKNKTGLWEQCK
ncbi:MAG: hypothetical protein CL884_03875 [Dehalococcoidia bacterium]|nr:hypothetical protein [Dehalococcoidia bacterium]CAI8263379.1 MAG: Thermonuclease [Chloroflexota bacterium]|tara:strand:- start:76 stop:555 length:480 start_codon:yes stop_codon:yes gene_type:complete